MRLGSTDTLINPQIKFDGKWEVSLCGISLNDPSLQIDSGTRTTTTTMSGFRKIRKSDFPLHSITPHHNLFMIIQIKIDDNRLLRLNSRGRIIESDTDTLKEECRRYTYGTA